MNRIILVFLLLASLTIFSQNNFPPSGNVGIGTTNPVHGKLHINGTGASSGINLWTNSGVVTSRIWIDNQNKSFHLSRGDNPVNGITISNTGLVGIGSINPEHGRLHINGNGASQGINLWTNSGETTSRIWIDNQNQTFHLSKGDNPVNGITISNTGLIGIGEINPDHGRLHINGNGASQGINLWTNSGEKTSRIWIDNQNKTFHLSKGDNPVNGITISNTGLVGIGEIIPDSKLSVNGKIHAKEVKIDLIGWSDFVFYEDYNLPTLTEVETYIEENGHLQDIPSAEEVQENGINLGEMNAKLLQKIEELMLYTIQQEKQIKLNKDLKNRITVLEIKIIELLNKLEKVESIIK